MGLKVEREAKGAKKVVKNLWVGSKEAERSKEALGRRKRLEREMLSIF